MQSYDFIIHGGLLAAERRDGFSDAEAVLTVSEQMETRIWNAKASYTGGPFLKADAGRHQVRHHCRRARLRAAC
jgi:hypothetical protein